MQSSLACPPGLYFNQETVVSGEALYYHHGKADQIPAEAVQSKTSQEGKSKVTPPAVCP